MATRLTAVTGHSSAELTPLHVRAFAMLEDAVAARRDQVADANAHADRADVSVAGEWQRADASSHPAAYRS